MQIRKEILAGKYIQMDETTIKVLFVKKIRLIKDICGLL